MKILQVTNVFSPVHGGSAEVPYHLSKELAKRGNEVTVYTSDSKLRREYIDSIPQVSVHAFKTWLGSANLFVAPGIVRKAKMEVRHVDVIHMHSYRTFQNMVIHYYAKKHSIPYVLQAHGSLPRIMAKQRLKQVYDYLWGYRLLKDASKVIAVTETEAEQYKSMGVSKDKIEIVPHGVDLSEFDDLPRKGEFRRKYGLNDDKVILYLGRIDKIKGLDLLAKSFADLSKTAVGIRLVIVGPDSGYLSDLKRLVSDLRIDDTVVFTGPLFGPDKLKAYVDADVYVLPSSYEIFGVTVLEACACGTPVVITERCGIAEAIRGQAGLVVAYKREALQQALEAMLNDEGMRLDFGRRGRLLVQERYDWARIAGQIEGIYRGLLSNQ